MVLNHLTIDFYKNNTADAIIVCGDFNARVSEKENCQYINSVPKRKVIDANVNTQGKKLLTFVNDVRSCLLNGRITPEFNDYTSVTPHKGRSVVDYFITRQSDLDSMLSLKVVSCLDMVSEENDVNLIDDKSRLPDHSLLILELELSTAI